MAIGSKIAGFVRSLFGQGGGRGSGIASQNSAARLTKGAARGKAVRLPAMAKGAGGRTGAKGSGGGGG